MHWRILWLWCVLCIGTWAHADPPVVTEQALEQYGIQADHISIDNYQAPEPLLDTSSEAFATVQKKGMDLIPGETNWVIDAFLDFCEANSAGVFLDVGAGYGALSRRALEKGVYVISNEISFDQLIVHRNLVEDKASLSRLFLNHATFPDLQLPDHHLDGIILHRVLHFLPGNQIDTGLERMKQWLKPGGKIFIVVTSPYHPAFRDTFLNEYEKRRKQKDLWPGMHMKVDPTLAESASLPSMIHVIDPLVLQSALERHGYVIERIDFVGEGGLGDNAILNGQEYTGAVARYPG